MRAMLVRSVLNGNMVRVVYVDKKAVNNASLFLDTAWYKILPNAAMATTTTDDQ